MDDHVHVFPHPSAELSRKRRELSPEIDRAFKEFSKAVFAPGAGGAFAHSVIALATMQERDADPKK